MDEFAGSVDFDSKLEIEILKLSYKNLQTNTSFRVKISPKFGSNIFSLERNGIEYINTEIETLINNGFTGNYILFPFPNRIKNKTYIFENKKYSLNQIDRFGIKDLIHGLVFNKEWKFEKPKLEKNAATCRTYIDYTEKDPDFKSYPFKFNLSLTFILRKESLKIIYTLQNNSEQNMPYGFGLHPFFKTIPDKSRVKISVPASKVMNTDANLIPTGDLTEVKKTSFDLKTPKLVSLLELDHVFTQLSDTSKACLNYQNLKTKIIFNTSSQFGHLVIFTGNKTDQFICVENQTCATDAINLYSKGFLKESGIKIIKSRAADSGFIEYIFEDY